jgi:AcrR family transcriptional regulator
MSPEPDPPAARPAGRRSAAEAERTRAGLVAAARRLFAERGIDAVSTREIAGAAGVAHGLVRHHFGSKAGIWQAVIAAADAEFAATLRPLVDAVTATRPDGPQDESGLAAFLVGFVEVCARQPDIARLLVREGTVPGERLDQLLERLVHARTVLAPVLARLRATRRLPDVDDDEYFLLLLLTGVLPFGLPALTRGLLGRPLSARRHAEVLLQALVGAPPAARPPGPRPGAPARTAITRGWGPSGRGVR